MNRWAKSGVLARVFAALQQRQIIQGRVAAVSLDSTAVDQSNLGQTPRTNPTTVFSSAEILFQ